MRDGVSQGDAALYVVCYEADSEDMSALVGPMSQRSAEEYAKAYPARDDEWAAYVRPLTQPAGRRSCAWTGDRETGGLGVVGDADALDCIAALMSGAEWDADAGMEVADLVRRTGRAVADVEHAPMRSADDGGYFDLSGDAEKTVVIDPSRVWAVDGGDAASVAAVPDGVARVEVEYCDGASVPGCALVRAIGGPIVMVPVTSILVGWRETVPERRDVYGLPSRATKKATGR